MTPSMSTSKDNKNGVGVKANILCSTGATAKVEEKEALQTRNHTQVIMSPWMCPVDRTKLTEYR